MGRYIFLARTGDEGRFFCQEGPGQCRQEKQGTAKAQGILQAEQSQPSGGLVSLRGKAGGRGRGFLRNVRGAFERALSEALITLIRLYKRGISPILPSSCRFYPTCSEYAILALREHGPIKGLVLSGWRLLRCGPWSDGGYDPVPRFKEQRGTRREEPTS